MYQTILVMSQIKNYYENLLDLKDSAKCITCKAPQKSFHGSISGLIKHIKLQPLVYEKFVESWKKEKDTSILKRKSHIRQNLIYRPLKQMKLNLENIACEDRQNEVDKVIVHFLVETAVTFNVFGTDSF